MMLADSWAGRTVQACRFAGRTFTVLVSGGTVTAYRTGEDLSVAEVARQASWRRPWWSLPALSLWVSFVSVLAFGGGVSWVHWLYWTVLVVAHLAGKVAVRCRPGFVAPAPIVFVLDLVNEQRRAAGLRPVRGRDLVRAAAAMDVEDAAWALATVATGFGAAATGGVVSEQARSAALRLASASARVPAPRSSVSSGA